MGVPFKPNRTVAPNDRLPYAEATPDAFGAGIGRAITSIGEDVQQIDAKYQEAEARDADTELQKRLSKLWFDPDTNGGYSTKYLKDALNDGYKNVESEARKAADEIGGKISGSFGKAAFQRAADARLLNFTEKMSSHAQQQRGHLAPWSGHRREVRLGAARHRGVWQFARFPRAQRR